MAVKRKGLGKGLDALIGPKKTIERSVEKERTTENDKAGPEKDNAEEIKQDNILIPDSNVLKESTTDKKKQNEKQNDAADEEAGMKKELPRDSFTAAKIVKLSLVEPNRNQPRKSFDEDSLIELAESIKQHGVIQPLLVSNKGDYYEIIAGERRWRASKLAGIKEIPVIVKELSDLETVEISLIENIQREDLNPVEEAKAYQRLSEEFGLKQDEIADKVSRSRTAVTNSMRLLKLDEQVLKMLTDEMISAGHARALLALPKGEMQIEAATQVFDKKLSVRETEKLVKMLLSAPKQTRKLPSVDSQTMAVYESLEEKMKGILGTKVRIHAKKNKGSIEIEYYSRDELERLFDLINSIRQGE